MTKLHGRLFTVDFSFYLMVVLVVLTGQLTDYLILLIIMTWHECGHYFTAVVFKWPIEAMRLFMFGCVMDTDAFLMRPYKEQWLVLLMGPLQHVAIASVCIVLGRYTGYTTFFNHAQQLNITLLTFNLLPIWPLDGGKILYLLLSVVLPFKKSYYFTLALSIGSLAIVGSWFMFIHGFSFSILILIGFLFQEIRLDSKNRTYTWYRFLLARQMLNRQPKIKHIHKNAIPHRLLDDLKLSQPCVWMVKETGQFIQEQQMIQLYFNPVKYLNEIGEQSDNTLSFNNANRNITCHIRCR
ncbi:hypothetical protein GCM10012290_09500 [Halolactibacillus alkaliphilus]|uniref:Peptidase M50 domain-containing protein n=1 Tax=Halolactibacillus alkaliphilus TaxID=442899 RepID=A0A511WY11_9BACI|nr:site-2 protease family protein [Halolactibacillus alkaliphilus]GEN56006.1 hypothetical protein HAL01_04700 [Halolactibacillus alkaliphilus]GGN68165.1 hypothetical protein GCM10012290_09500 [Halolactibacillus alkaliphilus]